ncbi:hypothetical protein [Pricia sp.]|uniref:hypothetical protein n=1 Tax=Pricia sp. TaxID=2268138 RepID=UPI003592F822
MKKLKIIPVAPIVILLLTFAFSGCSKNSDDPITVDGEYFMRFKTDGDAVAYTETSALSFDIPVRDPSYAYIISGGDGEAGFNLYISSTTPIEANKTYDEKIVFEDGPQAILGSSLTVNDTIYSYKSAITTPNGAIYLSCIIKITEVSDTNIKGTFSGELRDAINVGNDTKIRITEGSFNSKRDFLGVDN